MASKNALLRKKLIKEAVLFAAMLVLLTSGSFLLSNYDDDAQSDKRTKETENNSVRAEHDSIRQQLGEGAELNGVYGTYAKNHNESFVLDREQAAGLMGSLREKHHLTNLTITISPVSDAKLDIIAARSGQLTRSEVHLSFGAMNDNSVYAFIESLQRELAGMIAVHQLKLSRAGELSDAVVLDASHHKITPLVIGELSFQWLGLRPSDTKPSFKGMP